MAVDSLRVICGPTAAGKSAVAAWLAERHIVTIISADSRQIYRGFDIGTSKPGAAERALAPHEGVDVAEPTERYSASRWAESALRWIDAAHRAARIPLLVGGTGFYLRALFRPLFVEPAIEPARRAALQSWLDTQSSEDLRRWCAALDPSRARLGRAQLARAVEIALLSGSRLSELHVAQARSPRMEARYLVVDPGAPLGALIEQRVRAMLDAGWVAEVRALARRIPTTAPAWNATGYRTIRRLADGAINEEDAVRRVVIETRQYAKRQRTWFRHQLPSSCVTALDPAEQSWRDVVTSWWDGREAAA